MFCIYLCWQLVWIMVSPESAEQNWAVDTIILCVDIYDQETPRVEYYVAK